MDRPQPLARKRVYDGRFLHVDLETFHNPAGSELTLEMVRHPGASAVVPVVSAQYTNNPEILMIRQFRYAGGGLIWEIPAGVLDTDEHPEECARRELLEETGATAGSLEHLTTIFTTPGFTDEQIHLFLGRDLTMAAPDHQFDEFIEIVPRRLEDLLRMIRDREIVDGKTIVALLYFAMFRHTL